jgi:hypothetical protein
LVVEGRVRRKMKEQVGIGMGLGKLIDGPTREKYWSEITDAEKVERMRGVVKRLERRNEELHDLLRKVLPLVTGHAHGADGKPVMNADHVLRADEPLGYYNGPKIGYGVRLGDGNGPDEVYF